MKEMKRFLSLFLCLVMLVGDLPANAFADEVAQTQQATQPVVETVAEDSADETGSADETTTNPEETTGDETTPDEGAVIPGESTGAAEGEDVVPGGNGADEEEIPEETEAKKPVRPGRPVIVQQVTDEAMSGDTAMIADDVNPDATIVIAASDYQKNGVEPKTNVSNILKKIKVAGYASADGFLFGGDYTQSMGKDNETKTGKEELQSAVQKVYGTDMDEIYVQGNHDPDSAVGNTLTASGAHDTEDYGVYVINQKDYPWGYGSYDMKTVTKATADALDVYLDAKAAEGYGKPIFVVTHLPLHITSRNSQGDGKYAKYLYDVLDEAGNKGLNIIFMFGHNHSSTYDDYIGGGAIYLAEGSTISIAKEGSTSSYFTDELSFTYMNCGYVGYSRSSADSAMTMTLFEITDDEVVVKRYDANGLHNLKAKGTGTGYPDVDTTVVETDTITLTTPTTGDDDDNEGGTTVPTQPSTVTDASGKVSVTAPGVTAVTVNKSTPAGVAYSSYARYDITLEGYTDGDEATVTIRLDEADGFRNGAAVVLDVEKNVTIDAVIADGAVTFKTTHFSEYDVMQTAETGEGATGNWTLISDGSGKTFYTLDTDGIDSGAKYLIVAESYAKALTAASSNNNSSDVTIDGNTITTDDASYGWTFTSSGSGYTIQNNGGTYLGRSSSSIAAGSASSVWTVSNENDGKYNITQESSGSWGWGSTYYVRWSKSNSYFQASSSSHDPVRLYKYDRTESAGDAVYAQMRGTMSHAVPVGTAEDTVLAAVLSGISVQTSADAAGTNPAPGDASKIAVNWETKYDAETAGTYNAVVTYDGVEIGTVAVTVREVTISGITVNPASGAVTVGASGVALVGATITVHVADEGFEDYTVPVTVGMLSGEGFSTDAVGTYENLTVTYMGKTVGGFTLNVKEKVVNNYPSYPNEGAVKVDKTAHGIDFQKTGVAQVELTASGVPMNQGVDVVIMLDTSSSMTRSITVNGKSVKRIDLLRPAVNELIDQLQTKRPDGADPDIDIVIASFNGNTINTDSNYISDSGNKPQVSGTGTDSCGVLTGQKTVATGWVDIMSLSTEWGSSSTNLPTGSGTNYDYGLELVYDLLKQKQTDNGENARKQFVLFMSDGAPSQYNGVWANDGEAEFAEWLLGNYDETDTDTSNNIPSSVTTSKSFYTGYRAGKGQLHRAAEAIKGSTEDDFAYVTYDSNGNGSLKPVKGLGATVYSIGLLLQDVSGGTRTAEDQQTVLNTIASNEDLAISITTVEGLGETFTRFGNDVLYAAENAFFADELGPNFNIQLANKTTRKTDGVAFTLDPAPAMEVREYTIWTRNELEDANGNLSEANAKKVGTRKTDNDGDFIYNTIEKVTFNADGTEAYLNDDTTKNVMVNNVINAKTFWYNNSTASVWIDKDGNAANGNEYELKPETFLWKVGTINTKEIALSYYVYLDDSLEGEASAGSYETNKYAILSYDNYLGNPCTKETVSPQMAWLSANVSYAYYLVNKAGQPVNANGEVVTFANREVIVNPTNAGEIKLNSIVDVESLKIASTGVLDDGSYALYDYAAEYELSVNSDATGAWEITVGAGKPATTYVTGFSSTVPFTNAITSTSEADNYDYTHTTVWFAVVWEPRAVEDTVVIDYGLPVDVHVLTNDFFGDFGTLVGVAAGEVTNSDNNIQTNEVTATEAAGTFGTAEVIKPATGANESNSVIRYTLNESKGMQMNEPEVLTYSVDYTNTKLQNNNGFYYGSLTVIPATTVYYEDSFLTLTGHGGAQWEQEGPSNAVQDEDRPGDINFAFDTVIDANNVYGYDSNYTNCSTHSLGSAAKINVSQGAYGTAEFTFYGTGFDVISMTSATTGIIVVDVYKDGEKYLSETVDTYYGYKKVTAADGTVTWETTASDDSNALYQIPVMKIGDGKTTEELPYGKYTAKITATYVPFLDHNKTDTGYNFYLDAIRIYNPAGTTYGNDGEIDKVIQDAYLADGEAYPEYFEVREQILSAKDFNASADAVASGIVFIDGAIATPSIADYTSYGPNNEVYLAAGQAIAFDLVADPTGGLSKVQLALKSVGGTASAKVYATDGTTALDADITTATDMYYDITGLNRKTVVIMNDGDSGILSITNLKATYTVDQPEEPAEPASDIFRISKSSANAALATMIVAEEPVVPETSEPVEEETEAPETSEPETSEPETSEPEETEPEETKPESSKDKLEQALAKAAAQAAKIAQNMKKAAEQAAKALSKLFSRWF